MIRFSVYRFFAVVALAVTIPSVVFADCGSCSQGTCQATARAARCRSRKPVARLAARLLPRSSCQSCR